MTAACGMAGAAHVEFEDLGAPVLIRKLSIVAVTPTSAGGHIAWGWRKQEALVGVDVSTGKTFTLDFRKYRAVNLAVAAGPCGSLFFYVGTPGRFFKYTPDAELVELGIPDTPASYWMGGHRTRSDVLYVGTYPEAILVACDMRTGVVSSLGRVTSDKREKYIIKVSAADTGMVYCSVGLHHQELWSVDPNTGARQQILPESMAREQGAPKLWTGTDGQVYGRSGKTNFLCRPDGIVEGTYRAPRQDPQARRAGDFTVGNVDARGRLRLVEAATQATSFVQTDYPGRAPAVFSIGCERDRKIYGGTVFPGITWRYDLDKAAFEELSDVTPKVIQIYDTFSHPKGLFFASYMGCKLDFFDPTSSRRAGTNPRRFKRSIPGHERPVQWEAGPDGKLYFGTTPAKGRLGGALVQVDPESFETQIWDKIMPDQSIAYLCAVPNSTELFGCASVGGGSSAIPSLEEAEVFLWDTELRKVVWRGQPVPGTRRYGRAVRGKDGLIVGLAGGSWYLFDPGKRETLYTGPLPVKRLHFPELSDCLLGPAGQVVGLGDDTAFAIDPAARTVTVIARHPSLKKAHGFLVSEDGMLYYGSGSSVWRCSLQQ
ncbi:MAG: hypothetical protein HN742_41750 [Lentisphaerae bacterium]|nr:hypothetical protein [Lentisphaerota bacterium]MBT4815274.1 hypothetical protein [Lentisphaerota bacterium]MBT5611700.1 hypothetical protein [Lentisphaerota bacterium]MBT7061168.1 hypothetical protein [Lentisphaerota bacterium]MBT7848463.1 hypothetical protein [Lentisphaerota bacterium]